jgi:hypothetical protein
MSKGTEEVKKSGENGKRESLPERSMRQARESAARHGIKLPDDKISGKGADKAK